MKYTDPDGRATDQYSAVATAAVGGALLVSGLAFIAIKNLKNNDNITNGMDDLLLAIVGTAVQAGRSFMARSIPKAIPDSDKDKIADHASDHNGEFDLNVPKENIRDKIDEVLRNPDTQTGKGVDKKTGNPKYGFLAPDGTLVIHNPSTEDKGTIFQPDDPQKYFDDNFK